jgi:hypothetical protein
LPKTRSKCGVTGIFQYFMSLRFGIYIK